MMWLIWAVLCMVSWGLTDILYKKGSPREDTLSCFKFLVWQGIIMGLLAIILLPSSESGADLPVMLFQNPFYILIPLTYPIAVMVGLNGKRYLDISVASPLENVDGAVAPVIMLAYFLIDGTIKSIQNMVSGLDIIGIILVISSVVLIGRMEQTLAETDNTLLANGKKKRIGAGALIFPLLYSIFDAICTAASGIALYSEGNIAMGEVDFLIIESLAFVIIGLFSYIYLWFKMKQPYNPFRKTETVRWSSGIMEMIGNICYTYAVASNPVLATPITSSYCIVTIIAARILLKERLQKKQYTCLAILIAGILLLGISDVMK